MGLLCKAARAILAGFDILPDRYRSSVRIQCCKLLAIKGVFHWLNAQYDMSLIVRITLTAIDRNSPTFMFSVLLKKHPQCSTANVASFPGHSQILFLPWKKIGYLSIFLHSCGVKCGSGLGMRLHSPNEQARKWYH